MIFTCSHKHFDLVDTFTESTPPRWLAHKENSWWYERHVLTLKVGESVESDFNVIKRIE